MTLDFFIFLLAAASCVLGLITIRALEKRGRLMANEFIAAADVRVSDVQPASHEGCVRLEYRNRKITLLVNGQEVAGVERLTLELQNGQPAAVICALDAEQVEFRAESVEFRKGKENA